MALPQVKQDALAARLAGLTPVTGGWSAPARAEAAARLATTGLPTRRDEYWRYTDPSTLTSATVSPAPALQNEDDLEAFQAIDRVRIYFVDGVFDAARSDDPAAAGVEFDRLEQVQGADIHWARDLYGALEARGQVAVQRPLAALNTAYATDGLLIRVRGKAEKPVALIYEHRDPLAEANLHHVIRLEEGAEFTLFESGPGAARFLTGLEVDVADGARFHHIRIQGRDHDRRVDTNIFARVGTGALFKSFTMTANGVLTRNEAVIELAGDDGVAHIAGAAMGDGDFLHDDTVFITHDALRCESRQVFKKVLRNGATGVFQGKILVKPGAQKTDGYQISQSLLLDDNSQFLAKPELEIYADDVKCSHGSTSGAIDETALFYLRSRGVPLRAAQSLLVLAFLAEAISEIEDEAAADDIRARLEIWLAEHGE